MNEMKAANRSPADTRLQLRATASRMLRFGVCVALLGTCAAWAGDVEDARAAYKRKDFAAARALYQPLADQGVPDAQFGIALMLFRGEGVRADEAAAVKLFTTAAEEGSSDAQAVLGVLHLEGKHMPRDVEKGRALAKQAADAGNIIGKTVLAITQLSGFGGLESDEAAVAVLRQVAGNQFPFVYYELGKATLAGRGTARDVNEGVRLLRSAADALPAKKEMVGLLLQYRMDLPAFREGRTRLNCGGVSCAWKAGSIRKALKEDMRDGQWLELAVRVMSVGMANDQMYFYLGRAAEGLGDLKAATTYYQLATSQLKGTPCGYLFDNCDGLVFPRDATDRLAKVTEAIGVAERQEAERLAKLEEKRKRDEAEAIEAAERLRREAEEQRARELVVGFENAKRTAKEGSADDQHKLAQMFFAGAGTSPSASDGILWLKSAAKKGSPAAQAELGERYRTGADIAKDDAAAELWLRKAAAQGATEATAGLAALAVARKEKEAAAAALARKQAAEREEQERKRKQQNAAILKSL